MRRRLILAGTAALVSAALLYCAETPIPPPPTEWVTDTAHFLSPATVDSLNARLAGYQQATGHQVIVYIAQTTGDDPIEDWTVKAFQQWKVGRKGLDDGLALFIMAQDHKMRIEVGYGLESVVPDVVAFRIIDEVIGPKIKGGHADEGVTAGVEALISAIGGQAAGSGATPAPRPQPQPEKAPLSLIQMVIIGIGAVLFLILLITHPALAFFLLANIMSGGGGGGGDGGGFSGGGGRSGGGGASGSW